MIGNRAQAKNSAGSGAFWMRALIAAAPIVALPAVALAEMPDEFLGRWSSDPSRCQQVNGEVDVLEVTESGFEFYEIGCELERPTRTPGAVRFDAQCYKGGSPVSSGTVIMRHPAPNDIDVALLGFSWTSQEPETFHRCRAD